MAGVCTEVDYTQPHTEYLNVIYIKHKKLSTRSWIQCFTYVVKERELNASVLASFPFSSS